MLTRTKRPYRLAARAVLTPEPAFTVEAVRTMVAASMIGPKGRATRHKEPSDEEIKSLSAILNSRHQLFYCAQQDRARRERRDRAIRLIGELREIMPEIVKDAEEQRLKTDDFFSRKTDRAAKALCRDIFTIALPHVEMPDSVSGWQWCARSLYVDVEQIIGANAAMRFIATAIPKLSGETPKSGSVRAWLKKVNQEPGPLSGDCVAKLKNEGTEKFRNFPVEMNFWQYNAL